MLFCGQFIAKDLNLWSTLLFVRFEKLFFSEFWGPLNLLGSSKKIHLLDSWPLSMHWINLSKNIALYLFYRVSQGKKCKLNQSSGNMIDIGTRIFMYFSWSLVIHTCVNLFNHYIVEIPLLQRGFTSFV